MKPVKRAAMTFAIGAVALLSSCVSAGHASAAPRVITVHARRYEFKPSEVTVKQGEPVKFVFISDDVPHGIVMEDLGVDVDIPKMESRELVVTPTTVGDFSGICSRYCGSGHSAMTFVVHVKS